MSSFLLSILTPKRSENPPPPSPPPYLDVLDEAELLRGFVSEFGFGLLVAFLQGAEFLLNGGDPSLHNLLLFSFQRKLVDLLQNREDVEPGDFWGKESINMEMVYLRIYIDILYEREQYHATKSSQGFHLFLGELL